MKKVITVVLIFSVSILFTGCNFCVKKDDSKLEKVKVAQFGEVFLYMPLYLADSKDFFKEEGIEIEITNTGGDDKTYAAIIGGSAIFGIADPTFVAIAQERGQGGKVIASIVNGVPFWGVTKNTNIPEIKLPEKLKGYSVATFAAPSTAYTLQYDMFEKGGVEPNIKQGSLGSTWAMVEAGKADIALELEPNVSTLVQEGAKIVYSLADIYGDFAITGVTVSDETIKNKPKLVQRFVNALQKAESFAHAYPDSVAYYASLKFPDIDKNICKEAINRMLMTNTLPKSTVISEEAWEKAVSLRVRAGEIKSMDNAKKVLDMSFAIESMKK